jgi:L,D-peptidoglycan transpeptidase YkuD (ErfK/YbiS/YcfS/YnhG family)
MHLQVYAAGLALWGNERWRAALGRGGVRAQKSEGDGATPEGVWPMRRLLYRADRLALPATRLPLAALRREDGWCDEPADPLYNRPVRLPYGARAEQLWREDGIYDLIVPLGYNDEPVVPGRGSAIFLHVARANYAPTEGCVALRLDDLLHLLKAADERTCVIVHGAGTPVP